MGKGIFLHTVLGRKRKSYLFINPIHEIICNSPYKIDSCLKTAQEYVDKGCYIAGYIGYEAGLLLNGIKTTSKCAHNGQLLYFAAYKKPVVYNNLNLHPVRQAAAIDVKTSVRRDEYAKGFDLIKKMIRNGEVYQLNNCFKLKFTLIGDSWDMFAALCGRQRTEYSAFIKDGKKTIISLSPELFFSLRGKDILMKPMKGTLVKDTGSGLKHDGPRLVDEKNRAENIMIVDLIRNDLGKICEINSVKVPALFEVTEYDTLYQMTSSITGRLKKGTGLKGIFKALFPSGSVTGAPKIRAMQLINETEKEPRGVYTGTIGFVSPHMKKAVFNVPIRTMVIEGTKGEMGIGSGIVHDSGMRQEYAECLGKAKFVFPSLNGECLIESLLCRGGKYLFFARHIKRLMRSAEYFNIPLKKEKVIEALKNHAKKIPDGGHKVRLLVNVSGKMKVSGTPVKKEDKKEKKVSISKIRVESSNIFLFHKTTSRKVYDGEYEKCRKKGFYDIMFFNEKGELTETHSSNIFIKKDGRFFTPPVPCGLLPGTYRNFLLSKNRKYREKVLYKRDLFDADEIYLCNSVRGMRKVTI
jgi:para-aminobenzoate synthetase/4-amino-4-deoxychorismate lyase